MVIVASKHPKCRLYEFFEMKFQGELNFKMFELEYFIRKALRGRNIKYEKTPLFIFVKSLIVTKDRGNTLRTQSYHWGRSTISTRTRKMAYFTFNSRALRHSDDYYVPAK